MLKDLKYSFRLLWKSPAFTAVAIAALALGIGANTAIFTVVNAVLLRPLPYPDSSRLVYVWEQNPRTQKTNVANPSNFLDWSDRNRSFESMAAQIQTDFNLSGEGEPEKVLGLVVTRDFFKTLGVTPFLGRDFTPQEDVPGGPNVVILSHELWVRRYGADRAILGRPVQINTRSFTVVGIAPPGFRFPSTKAELWTPLGTPRDNRRGRFLTPFARLKPGVSVAAAQADMNAISAQLRNEFPDFNAKWGTLVVGMQEHATSDIRLPLLVLLGAVGFVLLIACANVANLMLIRATGRHKEVAIRASLGASGFRIARQLLAESAMLALIAGAIGLLIANWSAKILIALAPESITVQNVNSVGLDASVFLFALAVSLATGLLFGLAPAIRALRVDLQNSLKEGARGTSGSLSRNRMRSALVVAEVALSLMLLIGAGLMVRSFQRLTSVAPGFEPEQTLSALINFGGGRTPPQRAQFLNTVLERARQIPQVKAAGSVHFLPLSGLLSATGYYRADRPKPAAGDGPTADISVITSGYFSAMNIPLLKGRTFDTRDRADTPQVILISQSLAQTYFPGEDPIGKGLFVQWYGPDAPREIIGVVGDIRQRGLDEAPRATIYIANEQAPNSAGNLVIRGAGDPMRIAADLKAQIRSLDPNVPMSNVRSLDYYVTQSVAKPRFNSTLMSGLAFLALVLAGIGIFGVMSYSVTQRTQEIGVRMALGAKQGDVLAMVIRQGMLLVGIGIALGIVGALGLTRFMKQLLFEINPSDPLTFAAVSTLLALIAALAIWLPARRATKVDPIIALRYE